MISTTTRLLVLAFGAFVLISLMPFGSGIVMSADSAGDEVTQARVGQEFSVKLGQQLKIEGEDLQIKFAAVTEDSRCPADVNCIWAGNARVALDLIENKCTTRITVNTQSNSQAADEGKSGRYRVKLVKLDPYPRTDRKTAPGDYSATLLISKE